MLGILGGCGDQVDPDGRGAAMAVEAAPDLMFPVGVPGEARRIYERFAGTLEQRTAGELLRAYALNGPLDECLEQAGFPEWDWSLSRGYPVPEDPLAATDYFAELGRRVWSINESYSAPYARAEAKLNDDELSQEQFEATQTCVQTAEVPTDDELLAVGRPPGAQRLIDQWRLAMRAAEREIVGADTPAYSACMSAADIPFLKDLGRTFDEIGPAMAQVAPPNDDVPPPGTALEATSEAWRDYLAIEDQFIAADVGCRRAVYHQGIDAIGVAVADFEARHAVEIAKVEASWPELIEAAGRLGFQPRN